MLFFNAVEENLRGKNERIIHTRLFNIFVIHPYSGWSPLDDNSGQVAGGKKPAPQIMVIPLKGRLYWHQMTIWTAHIETKFKDKKIAIFLKIDQVIDSFVRVMKIPKSLQNNF